MKTFMFFLLCFFFLNPSALSRPKTSRNFLATTKIVSKDGKVINIDPASERPAVWQYMTFGDTWTGVWTDTFTGGNGFSTDYSQTITVLDNTSVFSIGTDCNLSHVNISVGYRCDTPIVVTPDRVGINTATVRVWLRWSRPDFEDPGEIVWEEQTYDNVYAVIAWEPKQRCEAQVIPGNSTIDPSHHSLGEVVDIAGTDFQMVYSSKRSEGYVSGYEGFYTEYSMNLEGWSFSPHAYYNAGARSLHLGSGETRPARNAVKGSTRLVVSDITNEAMYFDLNGKHLSTNDIRTGVAKYSFEYDLNDRLVKVTDYYGNETLLQRDTNGYLEKIISPYGQETLISVDLNGRISAITNPKGEAYSMTYKPDTGLLATFTKPGGQTSTFTYDGFGHITKDVGHGGNFIELLIGQAGDTTLSTKLNRQTQYVRTPNATGGHTRSETDSVGLITNFTEGADGSSTSENQFGTTNIVLANDTQYGSMLRLPKTISTVIDGITSTVTNAQTIVGGVAEYDYDFKSWTSSVSGRTSTRKFYRTSGTEEITSPAGATKSIKTNPVGDPTEIQIGNDQKIEMAYDARGRRSQIKQGSKNQLNFSYDPSGYLSSIQNLRGEALSFEYDLAGRQTKYTLPDLRYILFSYDSNGNLTGVTPPGRSIHTFSLNPYEFPEVYTPPTVTGVSPLTTTYLYNFDRQLTQVSRPNGKIATYSYGSTSGLLSSIGTPSGNYIYTYSTSLPGKMASVQSPYDIVNAFDYRGHLLKSDEQRKSTDMSSIGKVSFGFDVDSRVISRTIRDSSSATFTRNINLNADDLPIHYGDMSLTYSYPSGRLSTTSIDNISDIRSYDVYGNLETYSAVYTPTSGTPEVLYSYTLARDSMSRIVGISETSRGVTSTIDYTFDVAGRLKSLIKNGTTIASYSYDSNGNRTSQTVHGVTIASGFDEQDRIINFGGKTYSHDQNGDLTGSQLGNGATENFSYDVFGNLSALTNSRGQALSYQMDGGDRRVSKSLNGQVKQRFLYQDDLRIAAELDSSGHMVSEFIYATDSNVADYMIKGGIRYRIISNHLGSPKLVVNTVTGQVIQRLDYDVWGRVQRDSNTCFQPFGFAGGLRDPHHQLVRFGARDYDPEIGRWTSKDPILFDGGDTNLFGYVQNDPVNWIDPEGLQQYTSEQNALLQMLKDINKTRAGISLKDAKAAVDLARECGLKGVRIDLNPVKGNPRPHLNFPGRGKHIPLNDVRGEVLDLVAVETIIKVAVEGRVI